MIRQHNSSGLRDRGTDPRMATLWPRIKADPRWKAAWDVIDTNARRQSETQHRPVLYSKLHSQCREKSKRKRDLLRDRMFQVSAESNYRHSHNRSAPPGLAVAALILLGVGIFLYGMPAWNVSLSTKSEPRQQLPQKVHFYDTAGYNMSPSVHELEGRVAIPKANHMLLGMDQVEQCVADSAEVTTGPGSVSASANVDPKAPPVPPQSPD